jgi:cysteine desulfurase/selenocysteine lyase
MTKEDKNNTFDRRGDFPLIANSSIAYLDTAASSQKPSVVIDGMKRFYETSYANVHRGIYPLSERATSEFEAAREKVARFINATPQETVFTRSTTDSINMMARSIVATLSPGDEMLITEMEHHSNFVPWQQLARIHGLTLRIAKITPDDELDLDDLRSKLSSRTKVVAVTHVSNVLGTINPIYEIARMTHEHGAILLVDGAQAVGHLSVDVQALDADIYTFSGHKMYGPDGIGVLYAKRGLLERLEPSVWGGEMVSEVTVEKTTWNELPYKFEPGTPDITQAVGLGLAVDYITGLGIDRIRRHEQELLAYADQRLRELPGLHLLGPADVDKRASVLAFVVDGVHPHDLAQILGDSGVAVRAGNHCTGPLHCAKGLTASTRASIGVYTMRDDIDRLVDGVKRSMEMFR